MSSELRFDIEFGYLERPDGSRVGLTAAERKVLAVLHANPGRFLTRERILDAISGPGSDKRDRNVDFLIARLRRKLSDRARDPRYIATRYGEGYAWIAGVAAIERRLAHARLVVGPLHGLTVLGCPEKAHRAARFLHGALMAEMPDIDVALAPDCPPAIQFRGARPDYAIEMTFQRDGSDAFCVICLSEFSSGRVIAVRRAGLKDLSAGCPPVTRLARRLCGELVSDRAANPVRHAPLALSVLLPLDGDEFEVDDRIKVRNREIMSFQQQADRRNRATSKRNAARLRALLEENPQNAAAKLMLAATIWGKYATCGVSLFTEGEDERARDEDEMEALVTEALPHVRANPEYAVLAAQLLHFLHRGHDDLARDLAESAFRDRLFTPGSLAVVGQLRSFAGETDAALECLDQAIDLSRPGSNAHTFATALRCEALAAAARWDALRSAASDLDVVCRNTGLMLEPIFCDPHRPPPSARALVAALSRQRASAMLLFCHYMFGRLFHRREAGLSSLRAILRLVMERFGTDIVPSEMYHAYPGMLDTCQGAIRLSIESGEVR